MEALTDTLSLYDDRQDILEFAMRHSGNSRNATRKRAEKLLKSVGKLRKHKTIKIRQGR